LATAINQSKSSNYFGIYYSGSTMAETGDWVVFGNNREITSISFDEIMHVLERENYFGYMWLSLDGCMTGKWVE
jgi:hypothetical protein